MSGVTREIVPLAGILPHVIELLPALAVMDVVKVLGADRVIRTVPVRRVRYKHWIRPLGPRVTLQVL